MTYRSAIAILENFNNYSDEEIGHAVYKILQMKTIMAVKKETLLEVVRYLFDKCYEVAGD